MTFRSFLKISSGMALAAVLIANANAQVAASDAEKPTETAVPPADAEPLEEIIVTGIRASVESATNKKRNAKQIVDSIVSEDVGKLPDNNVPEAMSRITGVQITRERGQGQSVAIRGLDGVQTTVNGNNTNLGEGRSLDLATIPAELVKAVDVYKTRSADQVEGSIAGTVNVELRRPLDLKEGLTVAGSLRGAYGENTKKISPYGSLLVGDRFDTDYGEIGVLVNGSLTRTKYEETYIESESPSAVCCEGDANSAWGRLPADKKNIIVPYRVNYGVEQGHVDQPSINGVVQWKPTDQLDFVLEGGYLGSRDKRQVDRLYAQLREYGSTLSNITVQPDGVTVRSLTINQATGIPVGVDSIYSSFSSNLYTTNLEAHWHSDPLQVNASAQYNWSNSGVYQVEHVARLNGLTSATIDFTSPQSGGKAPSITLNGVDLNNVANYGVERFQDLKQRSSNDEFATQVDATLKLSDDGFLRSAQSGMRYNTRDTDRAYGYRDGYPRVNGANAPLSSFPGGSTASLVGPDLDGGQSWYRIPGSVVMKNISSILDYIQQTDPGSAARFSSEFPPSDQGQTFTSKESSFAAYGQLNYAFDIGVPVDGTAGVRYVRTWGQSESFNYRVITGETVVENSKGKGDYEDYLPSVNSIIHFTSNKQLRLSYSTNVQRPSFYDMRPFYFVDPAQTTPTVYAGNPKLEAQREHAYDASAEYYFGRGGVASLGAYYKKASNFFYYSREEASDLSDYGLAGRSGYVEQLRNAGDGTFAGVEGAVQGFFDFLPGFWSNFGASLNGTYIIKARIEYPYPEDFPGAFDSVNTSKWTANAALYYDTPEFSARLALNYRSPYRMFIWTETPSYSWYMNDTYRLDAAINYTPVEYATLSLEATNLTNEKDYTYFGQQNLLPRGVRVQGRTLQASIRFRI